MVKIEPPPENETEIEALRREVRVLTAIVKDVHNILTNSNVGRQAMNELNQRAYGQALYGRNLNGEQLAQPNVEPGLAQQGVDYSDWDGR